MEQKQDNGHHTLGGHQEVEARPNRLVRSIGSKGFRVKLPGPSFLENILESNISFFAFLFDFPFPLLDHLLRDDEKMPLTPDI